ncbi:hypothetical protein KI743_18305 [Vibrio sp. D420a]|uniref:hypothetical protein n=1 Tax=Vibrio sp. D420a TaxID=2836895 RepID=UPI002555E32A|nr:hypothetical protein [Vibrio sp. D420a]MDK9763962.1 hypothetical protein [Vibrio sp. D420a]
MPIKIEKVKIQGVDHLNESLKGLADERGRLWKKNAFQKAGREAFKPVLANARRLAPVNGGLTAKALTTSSRYRNKPPKKLGFAAEYHIGTTLGAKFNREAPRNSRGKPIRYPFMQEVGIPPQVYTRRSILGNAHKVNREANRRPLLFQHRSLAANKTKVVDIFVYKAGQYVDLYAQTQYAKLPQALKKKR